MVTAEISGLSQLERRLEQIARALPGRVGDALRAEAEIEMTEAKRRTPVDTGALRASGHVRGPVGTGERGEIKVVLSFGGPAASYAVYVHENEDVFHKVGQSHFLSSVLYESAPYLAERVARRMRGER